MQNWKPRRNLSLIFAFIIGILTLASFGIYPIFLEKAALEEQINITIKKIETQRAIAPIYKELLERIHTSDLSGIEYPPAVVSATSKDIVQFSNLMDEIARKNGMTLKKIIPDAEAYLNTTDSLGMNIILAGDFFQFRQLLIQLCYIAFIKEIESIKIHIDSQRYIYEIRLIFAQG